VTGRDKKERWMRPGVGAAGRSQPVFHPTVPTFRRKWAEVAAVEWTGAGGAGLIW